jgi:hypothetical protein
LRALLIGVGAYPNLVGADLRGPVNDVRLIAEVLIARGVDPAAITVLTTDPSALPSGVATGLPTRDAILSALDALAATAGPGETVVVHYSGHGSQAPDNDGDEMGGMDEILLPMDVAGWRGSAGRIENAIIDDELQARMQAILDTGARLVGIIDACHSATGFRAVGAPGVARTLDAAALGVPADAPSAPPAQPRPPLSGAFVFLYSAQSDQRAFEYPLGDAADPSTWYGEFTRQLAIVLREAPRATWAQVLTEVSDAMRQGSATQTPDGEGPLLSAPIPGAQAGARRHAFADRVVSAGLLWGLTEGSLVAVYDTATSAEPVARARLTRLTPDSATLEPEPGARLPRAGAVEVVAPAAPPPLRLMRFDAAGGEAAELWSALVAAAVEAGLADWSIAGADLVPVVTPGGALAFAGADGVLDPAGPGSSPRIEPGADAADRLAGFLVDAGHALRLRRLLAGAAGATRGFTIGGPPLTLTVERRPGRSDAAGACAGADPGAPADPAQGVGHCDELWLTLTNRSGRTQDVTVLYQDRAYRLTAIYPVRGLSNRLARGESARVGLRIEAPGADIGREEIVVIAVAAEDGARRNDLTHLADPAGQRAAAPGLGTALAAFLDPETGRSFTPPALSPFTVLRQTVRIEPQTMP